MDFKLPEIGEGVHEGELIKWLVKDGDTVAADQPLLEVMTDKATVEVPSPAAGVISGIKSKDGDMIKVGSTLAMIEEGKGAAAQKPAEQKAAPAPQQTQQAATQQNQQPADKNPSPANSGEGTSTPEENRQQQQAAPANYQNGGPQANQQNGGSQSAQQNSQQTAQQNSQQSAQQNGQQAAQKSNAPSYGQNGNGQQSYAAAGGAYQSAAEQLSPSNVAAAPIVRSMAQKAGVDLASVHGTGPNNRVLEQDLLNFLNQSQQPAQSTQVAMPGKVTSSAAQMPVRNVSGAQDIERVPVRGLRRVIAQAMVRSKYTAPHYSYVDEFECSQFVALREEAKKMGEKVGVKITYLPFIIKAVVAALKQFPVVNSSLEENANGMELLYKKFYNIGFAVATLDGLLVPVIKHADKKTLLEIAHEMTELSNKVRAGKAAPDDLKGSTFSITSMGNIGGLFATPIINYPEVGILGVYKVQEKPIVQDGEIVIGKTMHLSLSLDHRVVDGAVGGYFCNAIIERLQNPTRLLMDMV